MKANHIFFTTVFLTVFCLFCFYFFAGASCPPPGDGEIILSQDGNDPDGAPRGPVFNPFTAFHFNNQVILNCSTSYGDVDVTLVSTAGDNYSTVFDTADGFIIIPISGLAGEYILTLTCESGQVFEGFFDL